MDTIWSDFLYRKGDDVTYLQKFTGIRFIITFFKCRKLPSKQSQLDITFFSCVFIYLKIMSKIFSVTVICDKIIIILCFSTSFIHFLGKTYQVKSRTCIQHKDSDRDLKISSPCMVQNTSYSGLLAEKKNQGASNFCQPKLSIFFVIRQKNRLLPENSPVLSQTF